LILLDKAVLANKSHTKSAGTLEYWREWLYPQHK